MLGETWDMTDASLTSYARESFENQGESILPDYIQVFLSSRRCRLNMHLIHEVLQSSAFIDMLIQGNYNPSLSVNMSQLKYCPTPLTCKGDAVRDMLKSTSSLCSCSIPTEAEEVGGGSNKERKSVENKLQQYNIGRYYVTATAS